MAHWHNTTQRYGTGAKLFHWFCALSVMSILVLGWFMGDIPKAWQWLGYTTHKTWGLWVMIVAVVWLAHKLWQKKVEPLPTETKPLRRLATMVKWILIVCALAMPLSGWVFTSAWGTVFYPLLPFVSQTSFGLPSIAAKNPDFAKAIFGLHVLISWIIVGAVSLHVLGALYHHLIKRDIVLRRMLPRAFGGLSAAGDKASKNNGHKVVRFAKNKFAR